MTFQQTRTPGCPFGVLLQQYIDRQGWSRYVAAVDHAGMNPGYFARLIYGERSPSREMVETICERFDLTTDERYELLQAAGYYDPGMVADLEAENESLRREIDQLRGQTRGLVFGGRKR